MEPIEISGNPTITRRNLADDGPKLWQVLFALYAALILANLFFLPALFPLTIYISKLWEFGEAIFFYTGFGVVISEFFALCFIGMMLDRPLKYTVPLTFIGVMVGIVISPMGLLLIPEIEAMVFILVQATSWYTFVMILVLCFRVLSKARLTLLDGHETALQSDPSDERISIRYLLVMTTLVGVICSGSLKSGIEYGELFDFTILKTICFSSPFIVLAWLITVLLFFRVFGSKSSHRFNAGVATVLTVLICPFIACKTFQAVFWIGTSSELESLTVAYSSCFGYSLGMFFIFIVLRSLGLKLIHR